MAVNRILVVNSSFPEVNQLAAALAEAGELSTYVRPYVNLGRHWEQVLMRVRCISKVYARTFGRRRVPMPLGANELTEAGLFWDFAIAVHHRVPIRSAVWRRLRSILLRRRDNSVARVGARHVADAAAVVASWGVALPVFKAARDRQIPCILNYPLAHHAFTDRYLRDEEEREPEFATTLNSYRRPRAEVQRLDAEIALADRILVGSTFVQETFIAEGIPASKLCVVPYGADTALFRPPASPRPPTRFNVLFVGQLSQRKGISYLLRAFQRFRSAGVSLSLVGQIQGDGLALKSWRHVFRHIPHVPRQELARIFQESDVFVFPTLVEGMPLVVIEAMASGLPVITTPNGPCDIVRDGIDGFVVPPRDEDALIDRMERLRHDPELRMAMGEAARERATSFTWHRYREGVLNNLHQWV